MKCYCGDDPYQYGPEDVGDFYKQAYDCNYACIGDSNQICGGFWRLSVYETGKETQSLICMNILRIYCLVNMVLSYINTITYSLFLILRSLYFFYSLYGTRHVAHVCTNLVIRLIR